MADQHPLLWTPSPERIARSRLHNYQQWLAERGKHFADYNALWQWSVENIEEFWASVWDYFEITCSVPYKRVLVERTMPGAIWFEDSRLNFAEQLFRFNTAAGTGDKPAVIAESEIRARTSLSWQQLRDQVTAVSNTLRAMGVQPGDRIAAYLPNTPEAVVAFFACASVGAIWSSCSPDMGASSVLDRFQQIEPKVLIAVDGYRYGGKDFDRMNVVSTLRDELKTLQHTVLFPYLDAA
ncbi:MAG: AMP-binding protein, partial [Oxalobacteraceae bacterium]|nr:AMP-binding protein [Oxalobacteraceae bacterium]